MKRNKAFLVRSIGHRWVAKGHPVERIENLHRILAADSQEAAIKADRVCHNYNPSFNFSNFTVWTAKEARQEIAKLRAKARDLERALAP